VVANSVASTRTVCPIMIKALLRVEPFLSSVPIFMALDHSVVQGSHKC